MLKPSSINILKRHGLRIDRALHNWVYFFFYRPYVKSAFISQRLIEKHLLWFKPLARPVRAVFNRYHSKVLSRGDVKKILTLNRDVLLGPDRDKRIIPFAFANKVIFREPTLIAVMDCPCKTARKSCDPVGCCIAVGKDFAPIWLEHCRERYNARQVTQAEALDLIDRMRKTGHVQQAFLKVGTGGLTGVICNCCPKCCVSLDASRIAKKLDKKLYMNVESGYSVERDPEKCTACGKCAEFCPFGAMTATGGVPAYDRALCMGCELCVDNCAQGAISLYADPDKVLPLDLDLAKKELLKKS